MFNLENDILDAADEIKKHVDNTAEQLASVQKMKNNMYTISANNRPYENIKEYLDYIENQLEMYINYASGKEEELRNYIAYIGDEDE